MKKNKAKKNNPPPRADQPQSPLKSEDVQSYNYDCTELDFYLRDSAKKEALPTLIALKDSRSGQIVQFSVTNRPPTLKNLKSFIERTFARLNREQQVPQDIISGDESRKNDQGGQ
jgi:hypothetical protein